MSYMRRHNSMASLLAATCSICLFIPLPVPPSLFILFICCSHRAATGDSFHYRLIYWFVLGLTNKSPYWLHVKAITWKKNDDTFLKIPDLKMIFQQLPIYICQTSTFGAFSRVIAVQTWQRQSVQHFGSPWTLCWMDWHEFLHRHSWSPQDEPSSPPFVRQFGSRTNQSKTDEFFLSLSWLITLKQLWQSQGSVTAMAQQMKRQFFKK